MVNASIKASLTKEYLRYLDVMTPKVSLRSTTHHHMCYKHFKVSLVLFAKLAGQVGYPCVFGQLNKLTKR